MKLKYTILGLLLAACAAGASQAADTKAAAPEGARPPAADGDIEAKLAAARARLERWFR